MTAMIDGHELAAAIKSCLNITAGEKYSLHEPQFTGNEWQYVKECLDTGWVSSVGKFVDQFERDLETYTGAKHAIVTTNGTSALHTSFLLAGVKAGDEVLVPSLTFVATCNAIHYCGAIPHFVDSEAYSLGVDAQKLDDYLQEITEIKEGLCFNRLTQRPIRALCVMHTFGHPVDLDALCELAERYQLVLIEDAAEALGSYYKGVHVGHRGLLGALSFNGNKIITTGGGGAILTNDSELARQAKHLTTTAKLPHAWLYHHDTIGYNYRLPNINAALGCAQLEQLDDALAAKRKLAMRYQEALKAVLGITFFSEPTYAKSNYWLNAIVLDRQSVNSRDILLQALNQCGIGVRPVWELMHTLPMFLQCPRMDLTTAINLTEQLVNLPSSAFLA